MAKQIKPMKRTTVNLTAKQAKTIQKAAKVTGLKASEHIRRAVDQYVKTELAWLNDCR
jgi:hypothetical protein